MMLDRVDKGTIPIFHIAASETLVSYEKFDFVNGCRLGIIMYGFTENTALQLQSTFCLYSEIIQIGYGDGIIRKNTGRNVYIHGKEYPIIGNICMDMLFVKIDDTVHIHDTVVLLKDIEHIEQVARYLDTIPYEVLCTIGKRVPRIYENS